MRTGKNFARFGARKLRSAARSFREDCAGEGYVRICVILLVLCILLSVILCYAEQMSLVKTVRNSVREALDGMAMQASIASYEEENEGNNVKFTWDEEAFFAYMTAYFPGVEQTAAGYRRTGEDGSLLWELSRPEISVSEDGELHLSATYVMTLPTSFGGIQFPDIEVPVRVESGRKLK